MLNRLTMVIFLFIILYGIVVFLKPGMIFNNKDNCLRSFGVGYKNTTIVPLWLISILFAIVTFVYPNSLSLFFRSCFGISSP